jgi:hypothetical protein
VASKAIVADVVVFFWAKIAIDAHANTTDKMVLFICCKI